jgi:hypothetical protein
VTTDPATDTTTTAAYRQRLDAVAADLASVRPRVEAGAPWPLTERYDHDPEATWGPPEVLAHVGEMLSYWLGEVDRIIAAPAGPIPFGRIGTDARRIEMIGRDRSLPIEELFDRVEAGIGRWSAKLGTFSGTDLAATGIHETRGEMTVGAIIERMLLVHLEEHAEQLQAILAAAKPVT